MRLDKFLKVSRLIKRRTVANEACDAGRVTVNGKPAKASVQIKPGDVIEIQFGTRNVKAEVLKLQDTTKKKRRRNCSGICSESRRKHISAALRMARAELSLSVCIIRDVLSYI